MSAEATTPERERRSSPRFAMPSAGGVVSVVGARLVNVSSGGMMIESLVPMKPDVVLPLRVTIAGRRHDLTTRVCSCAAAPGEGRPHHRLGLQFVKLPDAVREELRAALASAADTVT